MSEFEIGDELYISNAPHIARYRIGLTVKVVPYIVGVWLNDTQVELGYLDAALLEGYVFKKVENAQPIATTPSVGNPKYNREIKPNVFVDVYDVLYAFKVTDPCLQHAIKKALAAGQRGHKDTRQDLVDIRDSAQRALDSYDLWEAAQ